MNTGSRVIAALAAAASFACASETRIWSLGDHSDFEKATLKGVSLTSDGRVTLAPVFKEVLDSASVYLWALAEDSKGNVYAGGGGPGGPGGRLYVIAPNGSGKTLAEFAELEVHAIAIDSKDQVYAATSPDGKVYRIRNGKPEAFYDPKAKYIWGMAFNSRGELFVATGDRGELHRVEPSGKGSVFYKTPETHARSIAIDRDDNVILGTEPGGLIVRVNPKGQGFVVYQTDKREVTTVAVGNDGALYAAAVGNKRGAASPGLSHPPVAPAKVIPPVNPAVAPQQAAPAAVAAPAAPVSSPSAPAAIAGGSEVYRIDRDGFPRRIWSDAQDLVYSIGIGEDQHPLLGTGNEGKIYRIDSDLVYTELLHAAPTQVTTILAGRNGRIYAATGNVGKVYTIGPELEKSGTIECEVFDADSFSQWGRLTWRGQDNGGCIAFRTRSGNLDRPVTDWSEWSSEVAGADGGKVTSPAARFLQWRAALAVSKEGRSPVLEAVDVAYLPRNVAPVVTRIEITPPNYRFPPPAPSLGQPASLTLPAFGRPAPRNRAPSLGSIPTSTMQYAKGYIGARWSASDDNGDSLLYDVYIRGEKETDWKLLKEKLTDAHISWDSAAFPDGEYRVKVVASDSPDNAPDHASTAELVSDPFTIDNTSPEIAGLTATLSGNKLEVRWSARDAQSVIERAEYSLNGGDWTFVEPADRISDSKEEAYTLKLDRPGSGELTLAIRVSDEFENRSVAKTVVR